MSIFSHVYSNYRVITLPLDYFWTWVVSILLVEFMYYWTHRAFHELNILWAIHQFHHMDEDLNVTTAVRNGVLDLILYDVIKSFILFNFKLTI